MMGEVVNLCRLTEDKGEKDLAGESSKLGTAFRGEAVFCGDKICSAWKKNIFEDIQIIQLETHRPVVLF